jgi:hypothetical protein
MLADYAACVGPQYQDAVQNWHGLVRRIERGEPEIALPADAPPRRGRVRIAVAMSLAAAAALAVLWLGGRATVAALEANERPSAASWQGGSLAGEHEPAAVVDEVVVVEDDARPRSRARAPEQAPAPTVTAPVAPPKVVVPLEPARRGKPSAKPGRIAEDASDASASTLEQVAAIRRAYAAVRDGDGDRALRMLDAHAKQWPTSEFAGERDLLRVRALCAAGRKQDAEQAAAAFKRKHPGSPLGAALKQCGSAQ